MSDAFDQFLVKLQFWVPTHLLSRLVGALACCRITVIKNALIRSFIWLYNIDTGEAENPVPAGYPDFNAFFSRSLRPGSRPLDNSPSAVVSPADGTITQIGRIADQQLSGGAYATIYLAPNNYHRVHMPLNAELIEMVYVPGRLLSVNVRTADVVPGLFTRNERLICHFNGPVGPFSIVMIGAMNVGNISTAWAGQVMPRLSRETVRWSYPGAEPAVRLNKGQYLGQFNLGSTVIMIAGPGQLTWHQEMTPGSSVRMGQRIGELMTDPAIV